MRSVIASPCCTRARSGRWEPWSKSSRRRIPWSGSSLRDAPGQARERVRRGPRRDRGVRGRGGRRLVALGCPPRPHGGGLHRPVPDRRRSERRGPSRPAWRPRRPRGGNPARQRKLGRGGPEDLRRHARSEEHTSELQSQSNLVCRLLLEKKKQQTLLTRMMDENSRLSDPNDAREVAIAALVVIALTSSTQRVHCGLLPRSIMFGVKRSGV